MGGERVEGMGLGTHQQCHTKYFCLDRKVRLFFFFFFYSIKLRQSIYA